MNFRYISCFIFSFYLSIGLSQSGSIKGIILNTEGQPVPFVSIQLKEILVGTLSNDKGEFELRPSSPNTYTLEASFMGYKTLEKKIFIEANKVTYLTLSLFENAELLKEIVVTGYVSQNEKIISVGKIAIKPMDLPQSIATLDRQVLESQQVQRMSDVLMNTNGVYIMGATGGYQEEIAGRGFAFGSSNTFRNGIRYFSGMMTELSGIERVEIMKGSTAILFGNVAAGGIINLVTKKPRFDFGGEVSLRTGSYGMVKPTFDLFGGIGKKDRVAYRINGSYEKENSFRLGVHSNRYYINPSLLIKVGHKTDLLVEADYSSDDRTPDFGAGIVNYQLVSIPRTQFLGVPWSYFKGNQVSTTATINHQLSTHWKLSFTGSYRNYNTDLYSNTRPNNGTLITTAGTWIRNLQRSEIANDYSIGQLDLNGKFNLGKISNQFLLGIDQDNYNTQTTAYNQYARYDTINIFGTNQYYKRTDIPSLTKSALTTAPVHRVGMYVQDLIDLSKGIKLLAGVRYSYQQTGSDVYTNATNKTTSIINYDGAFSPRIGIVLQPNTLHSFFASYSNSYSLNTGLDITGNTLPPSIIDQYEVGIKNELFSGKLSANATMYRILNSNLAQTSLENGNTNTNIKELAGSVQSDGIEIDLVARPIKGISMIAGYSYNQTKYTHSNTFVEGSLLKYNPNHTANLSAFYSIDEGQLKGLSIGLTGVYIGTRYAGRSTRIQVAHDAYRLVPIPNYTQWDATLGYSIKNITLRGKVGNILDALNYNVHDDNSVNPITPRNISASIAYKF